MLLIAAAAFGFRGSGWKGGLGPDFLAAALIVFSVLQVPQLATYLLGAFARVSGTGAFAGLAAGTAAALLHQGLTVPASFQRGLYGGWIAVLHQYPGCVAQCVATAVTGLTVNAVVALLFRGEAQH
jgi:SSS family solute:Na+ symporter